MLRLSGVPAASLRLPPLIALAMGTVGLRHSGLVTYCGKH
jgi:hypothetical protein